MSKMCPEKAKPREREACLLDSLTVYFCYKYFAGIGMPARYKI
jgi:hypothetical protein